MSQRGNGQAFDVLPDQFVEAAASLGETFALEQRFRLDGRPVLFEQIAQLKAARAVDVVVEAGLAELEIERERHITRSPCHPIILSLWFSVNVNSAKNGAAGCLGMSSRLPVFQVMTNSRVARVMPTYSRRRRSAT